jgi:hypothetical protein
MSASFVGFHWWDVIPVLVVAALMVAVAVYLVWRSA